MATDRAATWIGSKWCPRAVREAVYARDNNCCVYCGKVRGARFQVAGVKRTVVLSLDHVTPHSAGGSDHPSNLVTACLRCNSRRRALTVAEFAKYLREAGMDTTGLCDRVRRALGRKLVLSARSEANLAAKFAA